MSDPKDRAARALDAFRAATQGHTFTLDDAEAEALQAVHDSRELVSLLLARAQSSPTHELVALVEAAGRLQAAAARHLAGFTASKAQRLRETQVQAAQEADRLELSRLRAELGALRREGSSAPADDEESRLADARRQAREAERALVLQRLGVGEEEEGGL